MTLNNKSAGEARHMMSPTLQTRFDQLDERRRALLAELDRLDEAQLAFRPAPKSWSLLEVAHHLYLVDAAVVRSLAKYAERSPRRRGFDRIGALLLPLVFRYGIRLRVPVRGVKPSAAPLGEIRVQWEAAIRALEAGLATFTPEALSRNVFRHPIGGPMTPEQTLRFLTQHHDHHLRQVKRIRDASGFPASRTDAVSQADPSRGTMSA